MRKLIAILSVIGILSACIAEDKTGADVQVGDSLPEFEVVMENGSVVTGSSLKGNVSVLMFFHPSCPDCQQALPRVQSIYDEYAQKGIIFTLISRECGNDEVRDYWNKWSMKKKIGDKYGLTGLSFKITIDSIENQILWHKELLNHIDYYIKEAKTMGMMISSFDSDNFILSPLGKKRGCKLIYNPNYY